MERIKTQTLALSKPTTNCVQLHGITRQELCDEVTLPVGTFVRNHLIRETDLGCKSFFLASENGRSWYCYRTFDMLQTAPINPKICHCVDENGNLQSVIISRQPKGFSRNNGFDWSKF